ncbi:RagB/SusD family nutrient uptake outer membrane protein [Pedobacter sp. PLR]|uniref:RagB/SusD family nutrient uptake outer membrane protein n=1 Tax=Pedobacter sp. PLR TaxID=2994465 RepID=UPI002246D76D|nr:RagB/SusD family nutrient uptake outer membrane protein [Pedobacter sp. PLR]MCX2452246.1 RagB/SusD family nutrient uptake outer membrane protein [Pedobacter sp. PLR]
MKNNYKVPAMLSIFGLLLLGSCKKSFLTPNPLSIFTPENTYVDKGSMIALLNTSRVKLRNEFLNDNPLISTEYNASDLTVNGETAPQSLKDFDTQLTPNGAGNSKILDNSDSGGESSYWSAAWDAVKAANIVITRHSQAKYSSEADKNEILSEGYFHRAYWYYRIVNQYGDVPLLLEEITKPTLDLQTSSRKRILRKMMADMEFAVKWLPVNAPRGAVNRAAGYHLLTKIYLCLGMFDQAISAANEVINKSGLALMTNRFGVDKANPKYNVLWDLFRKQNISLAENTEGILIGQDRYQVVGGTASGSQRTRTYGPLWTGITGTTRNLGDPQYVYLLRGIARSRPSVSLAYGIWANSSGDYRHTWPNWFPMDSLKYNNPANPAQFNKPIPKSAVTDTIRCWFPFQYYKIVVPDEVNSPLISNDARGGYTDVYIFRLAETYLLRAEAYYWKNLMSNAADDINAVRRRANAPLIGPADVTMDYILDERARELFTEEPRKTELTRIAFIMADQGKNGYSTGNIDKKNYFYDRVMAANNFYGGKLVAGGIPFKMSPFHMLWPIPQSNINANTGGQINQNLGYTGSESNVAPLE